MVKTGICQQDSGENVERKNGGYAFCYSMHFHTVDEGQNGIFRVRAMVLFSGTLGRNALSSAKIIWAAKSAITVQLTWHMKRQID